MKHERYVPQYISDQIIDELIKKLLSDRKYYPKMPESFKYELTVRDNFYESRFKHGIKKTPLSYSKTIPSSHCMLEFEIMKETNGKLEPSGILMTEENQKIKVTISGVADRYYLEIGAERLRQLLTASLVDTITKPCAEGVKIYAVIVIEIQTLVDNCVTLR